MNNNSTPSPANNGPSLRIQVTALVELQLSQWQELRDSLQQDGADKPLLDYCAVYIDRLKTSAMNLANGH